MLRKDNDLKLDECHDPSELVLALTEQLLLSLAHTPQPAYDKLAYMSSTASGTGQSGSH